MNAKELPQRLPIASAVEMAVQATEKSKLRIFLTGIVKLAVDSAVTRSPKGSSGLKKAERIVQDRLNELPTSLPCSSTKKAEELSSNPRMKLEAEDVQEASIVRGERRKLANELPGEGIEGGGPSENGKKRTFIRSRL